MKLKITHIYPDLLNLYGDRGNIECLRHRLLWRGIDVEIEECTTDMPLNLENSDIVFWGGGTDREEAVALSWLMNNKDEICRYAKNNGVIVALCGGFAFLGKSTVIGGEETEVLGIVNMHTELSEKRFTGDVVAYSPLIDSDIVGFENHSTCTYTEGVTPLCEVLHGGGNNGADGTEGIVDGNIFGTYLHGPLFPKNPKLCDYILEKALKRKYSDFGKLCDIDDTLENNANDFIRIRYIK